jgi:hypothetical protein
VILGVFLSERTKEITRWPSTSLPSPTSPTRLGASTAWTSSKSTSTFLAYQALLATDHLGFLASRLRPRDMTLMVEGDTGATGAPLHRLRFSAMWQ